MIGASRLVTLDGQSTHLSGALVTSGGFCAPVGELYDFLRDPWEHPDRSIMPGRRRVELWLFPRSTAVADAVREARSRCKAAWRMLRHGLEPFDDDYW